MPSGITRNVACSELNVPSRTLPVATVEQRDALAAAIRQRLAPLCTDWPLDAFEAMVERLTAITLKYQGISSAEVYDRRSTDRIIDELRDVLERSMKRRRE